MGKYVDLTESYKSLNEALAHGGIPNNSRVNLEFIDSETVDGTSGGAKLVGVDGSLVPGGFGSRGIEGKICAAKYARTNGIPYFGICLGMQIAVIEFARHVAGLENAHSAEFNPLTVDPVIYLMLEWQRAFGDSFSAGIAYNYYRTRLDSTDRDTAGRLETTHHGPLLFLSANF